jgi:hypothetical protein
MRGEIDGDGSNIDDGASDSGSDDRVFARSTPKYSTLPLNTFFIRLYTRFASCDFNLKITVNFHHHKMCEIQYFSILIV